MKKTMKLLGIMLLFFALVGLLFAGCTTNAGAVFTATILHIEDDSVLVEVIEGGSALRTSDRVAFDRSDLEDIGASIGDRIVITYTGSVRLTDPAQISAIGWVLY